MGTYRGGNFSPIMNAGLDNEFVKFYIDESDASFALVGQKEVWAWPCADLNLNINLLSPRLSLNPNLLSPRLKVLHRRERRLLRTRGAEGGVGVAVRRPQPLSP